jgi:CHAD domain-containing protein
MPDPVVFSIGAEVNEARIARWVPGTRAAAPARTVERTLLDTFDGRLRRRGLTLWREGRPGSTSLRLEGHGTAPVPVNPSRRDRLRACELPAGVLGDRLRDLIGERALLPRARIRVRGRPLKVCNGEGKTVVRVTVEEASLAGGHREAVDLGRRLRVTGVLGYDRDMSKVVASLDRRLGRATKALADEAVAAAGLASCELGSDVDPALQPGTRADAATAEICRRLADTVEVNLPGVLADLDPEFLHDLRVAVRRSRSVLKEMRGVLAPAEADRSRVTLRWIQEITGPTRDLDVLLHDWPAMAEPVPAAMAVDLQPLLDILGAERQRAYESMRRTLRGRRFATGWRAWRETLSSPVFAGTDAVRPIEELAGARIVAVYGGMRKMGRAIGDDSPPSALHELRKKGKELRYLLELFGGLWAPDRVKPLVGSLKGLQEVLGHFQDDEIQVGELRRLGPAVAATPGGTDSLIALGFVIEGLTVRQMQARQDFARRFAEFAGPATRGVVERTFG